MEIRHLRLIKSIVEEGSIANAIDKLHLTPSALSHQLKEAEWQTGAKIFFRVKKKLILTPIGEKLYASAKLILGELERVEKEVQQLIAGERGTIRISTECHTSYHWLPSLLRKFNQQCPGIEIKILFETNNRPVLKLLEEELDLAITNHPLNTDKIEFIELFKDEMWAVTSSDHAWAEKSFVLASDFTNENLIIHSEPLDTVVIYKDFLLPAGIKPKTIISIPSTEAAIEMVKAGMGITVLPQWALKPYLNTDEIKLTKLTSEGIYHNQYVALLKQESYPEYINYFIKFLKEAMVTH